MEKLIYIEDVNPVPLSPLIIYLSVFFMSEAVLSLLFQIFWYGAPNVGNYISLKCIILAITDSNPEK